MSVHLDPHISLTVGKLNLSKRRKKNMTSFMQKKETVERKWYVIDSTNIPYGRLASFVAVKLMGKDKPIYTPNVDCGDYIIIINAVFLKPDEGET